MASKQLFGAEIVNELSHRAEEATNPEAINSLFDFVNTRSKTICSRWHEHFIRRNVPCVVIMSKAHGRKMYTLLKRKFVYNKERKEYSLKSCSCNPLDSTQACQHCRPDLFKHHEYSKNKAA